MSHKIVRYILQRNNVLGGGLESVKRGHYLRVGKNSLTSTVSIKKATLFTEKEYQYWMKYWSNGFGSVLKTIDVKQVVISI